MDRLLDRINSPSDVKSLSLPQLQQLAEEIRAELITALSRTGGHLGPNLGVVELPSPCTTSLTLPATIFCSM